MTLTIDRIEGDLAVALFYGETVHIPVADLPADTVEGTVLALTVCRVPDDREDAEARLERLRQTGPSGDSIDL